MLMLEKYIHLHVKHKRLHVGPCLGVQNTPSGSHGKIQVNELQVNLKTCWIHNLDDFAF